MTVGSNGSVRWRCCLLNGWAMKRTLRISLPKMRMTPATWRSTMAQSRCGSASASWPMRRSATAERWIVPARSSQLKGLVVSGAVSSHSQTIAATRPLIPPLLATQARSARHRHRARQTSAIPPCRYSRCRLVRSGGGEPGCSGGRRRVPQEGVPMRGRPRGPP